MVCGRVAQVDEPPAVVPPSVILGGRFETGCPLEVQHGKHATLQPWSSLGATMLRVFGAGLANNARQWSSHFLAVVAGVPVADTCEHGLEPPLGGLGSVVEKALDGVSAGGLEAGNERATGRGELLCVDIEGGRCRQPLRGHAVEDVLNQRGGFGAASHEGCQGHVSGRTEAKAACTNAELGLI
jgi:hypothetical protein